MGAEFSSIELEIYSDTDIKELVSFLDNKIGTNYYDATHPGQPGNFFYSSSYTHLPDDSEEDVTSEPASINDTAVGLCALLSNLSPELRNIWDGSVKRVFDVGLDANLDREVVLELFKPETLKLMSELGISLNISVYAMHIEKEIEQLTQERVKKTDNK